MAIYQGRAQPVSWLGQNLYLIHSPVMYMLEWCGLVFDHNAKKHLRVMDLWLSHM